MLKIYVLMLCRRCGDLRVNALDSRSSVPGQALFLGKTLNSVCLCVRAYFGVRRDVYLYVVLQVLNLL